MTVLSNRLVPLAIILVGAISLSQAAIAGPTWPEGPGCGPFGTGNCLLPYHAQVPDGTGQLARITGSLDGLSEIVGTGGFAANFEDVFLIKITDPALFAASTSPSSNGSASFNSQLFLFTGPDHPDGPGLGMFANDDEAGSLAGESRITGGATDGSSSPAFIPGLHYMLGISGMNNVPESDGGSIFTNSLTTEISGPDGPGGGNAISGWSGSGEFGTYQITLLGTEFATIPSPSTIALFVTGMAFGSKRRRR